MYIQIYSICTYTYIYPTKQVAFLINAKRRHTRHYSWGITT